MVINSEEDNKFIQNAIVGIVRYFEDSFDCIVTVSDEFPSNKNVISLDITLPPNKEIFAPTTKELRVFRVDMTKQIMTVMYFPEQV